MAAPNEPSLTAPHQLKYTYKRSLGPVLSKFFTGLRDREILGITRSNGDVMVPPKEYDPDTGASLDALTPVAQTGEVVSWSWVAEPRRQQPIDHPFAYALVKLDGTATPFVHVVDGVAEADMRTGLRVKAKWADEPQGAITDFVFVAAD